MKTMIKKSILLVALFLSVGINASNGETGVTVKVVDAKLVELSMGDYKGSAEVTVRDVFGVILHNEVLQPNQLAKKYDFGTLPLGNYNVEIETQTKIESVDIIVAADKIDVVAESSTYFKPIIHVVDDVVTITKLGLDGESMEVSIYSERDDLIYYQSLENGPNLGVRLSFEVLGKGTYTARMYSDNKLFIEEILIK